jgi:hypothetical protein
MIKNTGTKYIKNIKRKKNERKNLKKEIIDQIEKNLHASFQRKKMKRGSMPIISISSFLVFLGKVRNIRVGSSYSNVDLPWDISTMLMRVQRDILAASSTHWHEVTHSLPLF